METKDTLTLSISCLALAVSLVSAYYTYRADQRAEAMSDPIMTSRVERRGLRDFTVNITVRNRASRQIQVQKLDLIEPAAGVLLQRQSAAEELVDAFTRQQMLIPVKDQKPRQMPIGKILDPDEAASFYFQVALPDRAAAPDQMKARMSLTIGTGSEFKSPVRFAVNSTE